MAFEFNPAHTVVTVLWATAHDLSAAYEIPLFVVNQSNTAIPMLYPPGVSAPFTGNIVFRDNSGASIGAYAQDTTTIGDTFRLQVAYLY